jgi:hypothetical protein
VVQFGLRFVNSEQLCSRAVFERTAVRVPEMKLDTLMTIYIELGIMWEEVVVDKLKITYYPTIGLKDWVIK